MFRAHTKSDSVKTLTEEIYSKYVYTYNEVCISVTYIVVLVFDFQFLVTINVFISYFSLLISPVLS